MFVTSPLLISSLSSVRPCAQRRRSPWLVAAIALLAAPVGCGSVSETNPDGAAIDELFAGFGPMPVAAARRVEGAPSAPVDDGDYRCVTKQVDEVRHYDQLLGQLALGDVLWPGSILRGSSVESGQLTPLVFERAPLRFSVSLESLGGGARSATLDAPSLSSYRSAIGQLLGQQLTGSIPARIATEIEEVSSEEQLAVALGVSASAPLFGSVKAGFNFRDSSKRSRFVAKFFQIYYTVDVDPPGQPHELFAPQVNAKAIADATAGDPPVYVSSIGYGRQVVFTFESDLAKSELQAALDFVYQGGAAASGNVSLTHQEVLAHTHTTAFILGGDAGTGAAASIGSYDQLKAFIAAGGNYSKDSPGAAIAYKLSYVHDNTPVRVAYASSYANRACSRVAQRLHVVFEKLTVDSAGNDAGGDLEMFGTVEARGAGTNQTLVSWSSSMLQRIAAGASFPPSGIIGEAIVAVRPQPGNEVRIRTSLLESDATVNDSFGDGVEDPAPFEAGWRRTLQIHRSSGTQAVTLQVSITPVP